MASLKRSKPMTLTGVGGDQSLSVTEPSPAGAGNMLKRNYRHDMGSKPHLILNLSAKRFGRSFLIP